MRNAPQIEKINDDGSMSTLVTMTLDEYRTLRIALAKAADDFEILMQLAARPCVYDEAMAAAGRCRMVLATMEDR